MAVREMDELVQNGLDRALEIMALAAHNSFRFESRNTIKMLVADKEEMEAIAEFSSPWPTCPPCLPGTAGMSWN